MRAFLSLISLVLLQSFAMAQDTVRVMHYNLLNYGNTILFCDNACKDQQLRTVMAASQPHILVVNELGANAIFVDRILVNVLNINGETRWQAGTYVNTTTSSIVSMIFYRSDKVGLAGQTAIEALYRDILNYNCYYKAADLATNTDTVFFYIASAHLKAGSTQSDVADRTAMANAYMTWLSNASQRPANRLMTGDFNVNTSNEGGYQAFINPANTALRYNDPINSPGSWSSNSAFANLHTQSTRTNSEADGGSGGGSDDRLDFILASDAIMNGTEKMTYVPGTYKAFGQDGLRFDQAIMGSQAVTATVALALHRMSDHLPVIADFAIDAQVSSSAQPMLASHGFRFLSNPVSNQLVFKLNENANAAKSASVLDVQGRVLAQMQLQNAGTQTLDVAHLPTGVYVLRLENGFGARFIKN